MNLSQLLGVATDLVARHIDRLISDIDGDVAEEKPVYTFGITASELADMIPPIVQKVVRKLVEDVVVEEARDTVYDAIREQTREILRRYPAMTEEMKIKIAKAILTEFQEEKPWNS